MRTHISATTQRDELQKLLALVAKIKKQITEANADVSTCPPLDGCYANAEKAEAIVKLLISIQPPKRDPEANG